VALVSKEQEQKKNTGKNMTTSRPPGSRRRAGGFSVLDLLVTVSVAGTLVAVGVPSFTRLLQDSRRTAVVNELQSTMMTARSDAMRLNRPIVVCGFAGAASSCGRDWSGGWQAAAWNDADANGRVAPGELDPATLRIFVNRHPSVAVSTRRFASAPGPLGVAVLRPPGQFSSPGTLTVCDARGARAARGVVLSATGRSRVTSRGADGRPLTCGQAGPAY
jgi:type IV fimbrial biogenesis protein FimT